jgi:hypothetical protein
MSSLWQRRIGVLSDHAAWRFPFPGLTFATVAEFKGLENRFIALTDVEDLDSSPAALATLYVGMSRAQVQLWIALHKRAASRQRVLSEKNLEAVMRDLQHAH